MSVMQRIRKERRPTNRKSEVFLLSFSHDVFFFLFLKRSVQYITMYSISVFPCCSVFFPVYRRKYSMNVYGNHVGIFHMFFLPHTKLRFPCMQGNFSYVIFLFHTKLIFPCMQGDLNKSNTRNIFVGCKWKFTFQTKPLWVFATVMYSIVFYSIYIRLSHW